MTAGPAALVHALDPGPSARTGAHWKDHPRQEEVSMSTLHCPLCGLRFRYGSELDTHARDDHGPQPLRSLPPRPRPKDDAPEREPVLHLPW